MGSPADGSRQEGSGRERNEPGAGGLPRASAGAMQSEAAGLAGEPSGQGEEPPPHRVLVVTICSPAERAVQRSTWTAKAALAAKRGSAPRRIQVSDGVFDLGVAAMVGLQIQGVPVPVGDEAVIAVGLRAIGTRAFTRRTMKGLLPKGCKRSRPDRRRPPSNREWASRHL